MFNVFNILGNPICLVKRSGQPQAQPQRRTNSPYYFDPVAAGPWPTEATPNLGQRCPTSRWKVSVWKLPRFCFGERAPTKPLRFKGTQARGQI